MGHPSCQSSLLSDPNENFSVEMSRRSNMKEGRHVGLDFYDLLIEALMGLRPGRSTRFYDDSSHSAYFIFEGAPAAGEQSGDAPHCLDWRV
jgi:hypothetical protein